MPNKLDSARQLGISGLVSRAVWRLRMLARILRFEIYYRHCYSQASTRDWRLDERVQPSFLCDRDELQSLLAADCIGPVERTRIIRQAQQTLDNRVTVRGHGEIDLLLTSGNWYDYADCSVMMNRHDYLPPLCQAYQLTRDSRYLTKIDELFNYWCDSFSVTNLKQKDTPIDTAIRLLNWLWVIHFQTLTYTEATQKKLKRIIFIQLEYIRAWSSAGSNHLVLEALAAFVYGVLWKNLKFSRRWQRWASRTLIDEIQRQVTEDGLHSEQSTFYHHIVTTHFLKAYLTGTRNDIEFPEIFVDRLRKMIRLVHDTTKPDLSYPNLGDGEPLTTDDREHWEAKVLLPAGALLFGDSVYMDFTRLFNDSCVWFLGAQQSEVETSPTAPTSVVYEKSGLVVLRNEDDYLLFDAAPFSDRHFPHHGHSDALNVELCLAGESLVIDPGNYGYHDDDYRRYFRSTSSHNTLRLDGRDQSETFGVFGYGKLAPVQLITAELHQEPQKIAGLHNGYDPVTHRREIYYRREQSSFYLILDWITGPGEHSFEYFLHLPPGSDVNLSKQTISTASGRAFPWKYLCTQPVSVSRVIGKETEEIQGWYAPRTGVLEPITVLTISGEVTLPFLLVTGIWNERATANLRQDQQQIFASCNDIALELELDFQSGRSKIL